MSWSSTSSAADSSDSQQYDLEARATEILTTLANRPLQHQITAVARHISPKIKVEHGDGQPEYSADSFMSHLFKFSSRYPKAQLKVTEACVDDIQRKVWVVSEITTGSSDGTVKERIDMLTFDQDGILVGSIDHLRRKRRH